MSDEVDATLAASDLPDLFGDRDHPDRMLERIVQMVESGENVNLTRALISRFRASNDAERGMDLDRFLLNRLRTYAASQQELEAVHAKLCQQVEILLAPPLFPARFLGTVSAMDEQYARVLCDGSQRLVKFDDDVDPATFAPGDEVYLCHERNLIVGNSVDPRPDVGETAAVVRHMDDGRIVLADRDTEVVVTGAAGLSPETLKPGDPVLWDRSAHLALGRLERDTAFGYQDFDDTPPTMLAGIDSLRDDLIDRFVFAIANPELARRYGVLGDGAQRMLLEGPPGTGKTTLMRLLASMIARATGRNCRVVTIAGAELYSAYVGETERNIRRSFAILKSYDGPGIVFFDEIDAVGRVRGNASGFHDDRFLGTLLAEMEGIHRSNVAVVAATNRADTLDPALRGRFSREIRMPRPDLSAARQIFAVHLAEDIPYRPNGEQSPDTRSLLIEAAVSQLYDPNADNQIATLQFRDGKHRAVAARELVSGRLIEQICAAARSIAFGRHCRGGESGVTIDDMRSATSDAIARLRKTLSLRNVGSYLADLPQDVDVVSIEAHESRVDARRYNRPTTISGGESIG